MYYGDMEELHEKFVQMSGEFYALLCPEKLCLRDGKITTGNGTVVIKTKLRTTENGEKVLDFIPVKNVFCYPPGQPWVASGHMKLLIGLLMKVSEVGLEEALAEQNPRWIGGGGSCKWDVLFSKHSPEILIPPNYVFPNK